MKVELSEWIVIHGYCATRVLKGTDPNLIENRVAFIEKTPRIRVDQFTTNNDLEDSKKWLYGERGTSDYGFDVDSRKWCDEELKKRNYIFTK